MNIFSWPTASVKRDKLLGDHIFVHFACVGLVALKKIPWN